MAAHQDTRAEPLARALRKLRGRIERKRDAIRGDLAEAQRAGEYRSWAEALLPRLHALPSRTTRATVDDPSRPGVQLEIPLDPAVTVQVNAARYFRKAAKAERGMREIPARLAAVEQQLEAVLKLGARLEAVESLGDAPDRTGALEDIERAMAAIERSARRGTDSGAGRTVPLGGSRAPRSQGDSTGPGASSPGGPSAGAGAEPEHLPRAPSARLQPRRLRSTEGWDVLIGRNNEGNDYLSLKLARPEDYWFHVHGAAGSHVVLRRGKGKNEPSKATIEEVASWAAFFSQARTAGKVPVIVTRAKYVRKPRKAPPGTVVCEREKTVMVRPKEPELPKA